MGSTGRPEDGRPGHPAEHAPCSTSATSIPLTRERRQGDRGFPEVAWLGPEGAPWLGLRCPRPTGCQGGRAGRTTKG